MTDTITDVPAAEQEPAEPVLDEQTVAEQLVAQARAKGVELVGPDGLLTGITKRVLEAALEAEMADHLGYDKHDPVGRNRGNSRNGVRPKTVLTEIGPVEIEVPRDTDASFTPQIVKKRQRRLTGVDEIVLSLSARGLTTGEISAHFAEVYGASVSKETVSKITDQVVEEMTAWMNRPLDEVYPVIFVDAIVVKVRDGQVRNKPVYVVIGVTVAGERDILGLWAGDGGEGAKFWLQVLTELKNRGVQDVCIAVCDGLKGLPDAVNTVWELTVVQTSSVHHGCGGRVPLVIRAVSVRTCADQLPSRSRCRPVRPGRWRALHLPAGAAPFERRDEVPTRPAARGWRRPMEEASWCQSTVRPGTIVQSRDSCSPGSIGAARSTSCAC